MELKSDTITDLNGRVVPGALVLVLRDDGTEADIYDKSGAKLTNPVATDSNGLFAFAAPNGKYSMQVSANGRVFGTIGPITLFDPANDRVRVTDFMTRAQRADFLACTLRFPMQDAVQRAVSYVSSLPAQNRPAIVLPAGRGLITAPINLDDNIVLIGERRDIGYTYAFSHSSELIANNDMAFMIDYTGSNVYVGDLGLYCNQAAHFGLYSNVPLNQARKSSFTFERLSVTMATKSNILMNNIGIAKCRDLNLSGAIECALDIANSGDSDFDGLYINSNNPDATSLASGPSSAAVYGVGIRMRDSSGNINFRGGKSEFNRIGFLLNNVDGVTLNGIQFDTNRGGDIIINGDSINANHTTENPNAVTSVLVTGCRHLGGTEKTNAPTANIRVNKARYVTIVGSSIKRAGDGARDFATDTAQGHAYGIWFDGAELCTAVGNDLYAAGTISCIKSNHATPSLARHTIDSNSMDGSEDIQPGTVKTQAVYNSVVYAAGSNPIAQNTATAHAKINGNTNPATFISSYGFSSITGANGTYNLVFSSPRQNKNYVVNASAGNYFGPNDRATYGSETINGFTLYATDGTNLAPHGDISITVFG